MAAQQNKRKAENRKIRQDALREQLAGQKIIEGINRNIAQLEKLVVKANKADREGLDRIKVQMQGLNNVLGAQQKKLNKLLPDAKQQDAVEEEIRPTPDDRLSAGLYQMGLNEYMHRKAEGTLPECPEIPEPKHLGSGLLDSAKTSAGGCR